MEAKHTPGAWRVNEDKMDGMLFIESPGQKDIARIIQYNSRGAKPQARRDAAFIVRACNVHEELLAALETLAQLGEEGMGPNYQEWITFHDKVAQIARAAIAKTKEGL